MPRLLTSSNGSWKAECEDVEGVNASYDSTCQTLPSVLLQRDNYLETACAQWSSIVVVLASSYGGRTELERRLSQPPAVFILVRIVITDA